MKYAEPTSSPSRRRFLKLSAASVALAATGAGAAHFAEATSLPHPSNAFGDAFLNACATGDLDLARSLLADDPQLINAHDAEGRSGYTLALLAGHGAIGDALIAADYAPDLHECALALDWDRYDGLVGEENEATIARINADHPMGGTVMWAAAAGGAGTSIWRVYANCGDPDLNPRKALGSTPLQEALQYPDAGVAEITAAVLLSNNADPDPPANAVAPPLHLAAARGSTVLVEMLIRLGAQVGGRDARGRTAQQLAEYHGQLATAQLLADHERIPRTCRTSRRAFDRNGTPYVFPDLSTIPLYRQGNVVGMAHKNLDGVKAAVQKDPLLVHSVATTSEAGVEAGAHMGRADMVEFLLENGAPYSLPTAVMLNDFTSVRRMLDEDPQRIHERGAHDFALLWYPIIGGSNLEMAQLLLDRGARVEEQHFLGTTALHWACFRGPIEMVELLVQHGADVNRIGRKFSAAGETPLQSTSDEQIIAYLKSKGAH